MFNLETFTVLKMTNRAVNINLEGITHDESLVAPEPGGNSVNWIMGHMLVSRDDINRILGIKNVSAQALHDRYKRGTKPITRENAIDVHEILRLFNGMQQAIEEKVSSTDFSNRPEDLRSLAFHAFHEAYHSGQTGLLRRVAGKTGAIK